MSWLRRGPVLLALAFALAVLGAATAWLFTHAARPPDAGRADLVLGAAVYAEHCAVCHGIALEGEPDWRQRRPDGTLPAPPHDASGHTWHHADADLVRMIRHGIEPFAPPGYRSTMPAFGDVLDDAEIDAVLAFIKAQWPPEIRRLQERLNR